MRASIALKLEAPSFEEFVEAIILLPKNVKNRYVKSALRKAAKPGIAALRAITPKQPKAPVGKLGPRKHAAESVVAKIGRYKDGGGYWLLIGYESTMFHAHLFDQGASGDSPAHGRMRKKIGGKFKYVEWAILQNKAPAWKRRTGKAEGQFVVEKALRMSQAAMQQMFHMTLAQKVLSKASTYEPDVPDSLPIYG